MQASNCNLQFTNMGTVIDDIEFRKPLSTKEKSTPVTKDDLLQWEIPPVHAKACMDMARTLHKNHPDWSPKKVARKVAERYKLKPAA